MTSDEWAMLAFLMFLAVAVTLMVLAWWIRPYILNLKAERDTWKAEAEGWRESQQRGDVIEGVRLMSSQEVFLHGAAADERQTDDPR